MPADNAYDWFVANTNKKVVGLLDSNESVSAFMMGLLDYLVRYCEAHQIEFKDLILDQPFIGDDEYIRARIAINRV
jgi:hypothetical protein